MDLFIQIGIAIIAIAFLILMYAIVQTLKVLKSALEEIRLTIGQLRTDVSQISVDMKEAIHHTNAMTLDVRKKLGSLDVIFASVNDIGQVLHSFTSAAKESVASIASSIKRDDRSEITDKNDSNSNGISSIVIDGVISSLRILKKIKKF